MHEHRNESHAKLQRRVRNGAIIFAVLAVLVAVPLIVNDELRYNIGMRSGQLPGQDVEQLADGDAGALLVVIPLDHDQEGVPTPWLFKAQFIAWPNTNGQELENLETGERVDLPLGEIDFISANSDGSLVLMRGTDATSGEQIALTVNPETMAVDVLASQDSVPDAPGDWDTSIWTKQGQPCHRPSTNMRFLACFDSADLRSYFAGDWELNVQFFGDYEEMHPIFRGLGFLPITGFVHDDTVIYFQNENGVWRAEIPAEILEEAPAATPFATPGQ